MGNYLINKCDYCGQYYCQECSTHPEWENYCSTECFEEAKKDNG